MAGSRWAIGDFIEACDGASSVAEVERLFLKQATQLGFEHVALCSHVDPLSPPPHAIGIFRYPTEWLAHFSAEKYQRYDPVFFEAHRRATPFSWDDRGFLGRLNAKQHLIMREGGEVGLTKGYTIPIHGPNALPASCSLVASSDGVDPLNLPLAHSAAIFAHEAARRILIGPTDLREVHLTKRERECLTLAARGKTNWAISEILGLSERTVHHTMERAKKRLGVATRIQAVVHALFAGEIRMDEAIDWPHRQS